MWWCKQRMWYGIIIIQVLCRTAASLIPRLSCGVGGKRAWYTLFVHVPMCLCNLYSATLKLQSILFTSWKATLHGYTPSETHTGSFEVKNNIALTVTVCIALFEVIGEVQRERLCQSRATAFSGNGQTHGSEELSTFISPSSLSTQSVVSGRNLL